MTRGATPLRLLRDRQGSATIETAIVAPILLMMSLGAVDAGNMIARQSELQSAAAEGASIVRAVPPADQDARDTIAGIIRTSAGLAEDDVGIEEIYRCGTSTAYVTTKSCLSTEKTSIFIRMTITDTIEPFYATFGIAEPVTFDLERTVQVK